MDSSSSESLVRSIRFQNLAISTLLDSSQAPALHPRLHSLSARDTPAIVKMVHLPAWKALPQDPSHPDCESPTSRLSFMTPQADPVSFLLCCQRTLSICLFVFITYVYVTLDCELW